MAVAIEFGSQGQASTSGTDTATITGLDFNAEASDRIIAVDIAFEVSTLTVSSVTIGGVTAAFHVAAADLGRRVEIWSAEVPTGTSGNVAVTLSGSTTETISVGTHSLTGADPTPTDTDSVATTGSGVGVISITALTVPADGAAIAAWCNNTEGVGCTWTGANESHDTNTGASFAHSAASTTTAGTNTITADQDSGASFQALVGVAWGPASGGATTTAVELDPASYAYTPSSLGVVTKRVVTLSPASFAYTANDLTVNVVQATTYSVQLSPAAFTFTPRDLEAAATGVRIGPADDRPARRKRRDRETLEAYYAALQRKANEDAEREKLEALAEAERALEEAETAKKAEAKRAAVRKVFAALNRAALTEKAKAGAREAEQAALQAIAKRQTQEQREVYLEALDRLNEEIEAIGAQVARMYARRREEEEFLLRMWAAA